MEAASQPSLASITPLPENTALRQQVEDLRRQAEALNTELNHSRSRSRASRSSYRTPRTRCRNRRNSSSSPSRNEAASRLCWYHRRFGAKSQKYTQPCAYHKQGNLRRGYQRRHVSVTQPQSASSSQMRLVNGISWSTHVPTSVCTPAGSFRDARNGSSTTSLRLTALPSTPTDGCLSASTWASTGNSRGDSS
jgi:hypothetical protein